VSDPALRSRGLGRAMTAEPSDQLELLVAELFEAGVEPEKPASRRCIRASGFELRSPRADFEGMVQYCAWRRDRTQSRTARV
jgi:hypothetical protein